jgi:ferritin-like protein
MGASSGTLHEDVARLGSEAIDRHRAIVSIIEELEAIDWYDQRVLATDDAELRAILVHNRDEEKEHAAMLLEWLRRRDDALNGHLKAYLFRDGPISEK